MGFMLVRLLFAGLIIWVAGKFIRQAIDRSTAGPSKAQPTKDPYAILGISPNASEDEVKQAYHKAIGQHHPDKVAQMGEDIRNLADQKTKEILQAYQTIQKRRGM